MGSVALLVGGGAKNTSHGTELLLLLRLCTHPISLSPKPGWSAWFEPALGQGSWGSLLYRGNLHCLSLGILLSLFFQMCRKFFMLWVPKNKGVLQ